MAILMSFYKHWSDMILSGKKPFEFRSKIGKDFKVGDIIYLYETRKHYGCGKIVGEAQIASITKIQHEKCDTVLFVDYFLSNILKNNYYLKKWQEVKAIELPNYNNFIKLSNILCPDYLIALRDGKKFDYTTDSLQRKDLSHAISNDIDEWLYSIGYYNSSGTTTYNYAIELCNMHKYILPLDTQNFSCNDRKIIKAPQSWCYCEKNV